MTTIPTAQDLLSARPAASGTTFKFAVPGDTFKGEILEVRSQQQTEFGTDTPAFYKSGKPKMVLVVTVQEDGNPGDDGKRTAWLSGPEWVDDSAIGACRQAVAEHGGIMEVGGTLAVKFTGYGKASNPAYQPPKQYAASYRPPAKGVDLGGLLGDPEGPF